MPFISGNPPEHIGKMCDAIVVLTYKGMSYLFCIEQKSGHKGDYKKQLMNGAIFCNWLMDLFKVHGHFNQRPIYLGLLVFKPRAKAVRKGLTSHREDKPEEFGPIGLLTSVIEWSIKMKSGWESCVNCIESNGRLTLHGSRPHRLNAVGIATHQSHNIFPFARPGRVLTTVHLYFSLVGYGTEKQKSAAKAKRVSRIWDRHFFAILIRGTLVQAYHIPSGSMENTLLEGDYVLGDKLTFGTQIPDRVPILNNKLPSFRVPGFSIPQPGDLVIFEFPQDASRDFIKRCIANEGQTVEIKIKLCM